MFPTPYFEIITLLSEITLRLSPSIIKSIDVNVETATLIKIVVYLVIALSLSTPKDINLLTKPTFSNLLHYLLSGSITFITISLTYFAYKELPLQTSMAISSSFPIFLLIILQYIGFDQPLVYLPAFIIFYLVMIYNLRPKPHQLERFTQLNPEKKTEKYKATIALISAGILGCIVFIQKKLGYDNHETNLIRTNLGALVLSMSYFAVNKKVPDVKPYLLIKLILFNIFVGYIINKVRSLAIESVPAIYYGSFIFLGTIMAYNLSDHIPFFSKSENQDFKTEKIEDNNK